MEEAEVQTVLETLLQPCLGGRLPLVEYTLLFLDGEDWRFWRTDVPPEVPVTGFSVLFARWKGDLETFVRGTFAIESLRPGDRVLVAEACSHHAIGDDIGRVKIPRWLRQYVGGELDFTHVQGHDFPDDLGDYKLVMMCGACMQNRRETLTRLVRADQQGVRVTNYGLVIAYSLGVFERMLSPFPRLQELARSERAT